MSDEQPALTEILEIEHEITVLVAPGHTNIIGAYKLATEQNALQLAVQGFYREGLAIDAVDLMTLKRVDVKIAGGDQVYWAAIFKARGIPGPKPGQLFATLGGGAAGQLADRVDAGANKSRLG